MSVDLRALSDELLLRRAQDLRSRIDSRDLTVPARRRLRQQLTEVKREMAWRTAADDSVPSDALFEGDSE